MLITVNDMELLRALVDIYSQGPEARAAARLAAKLAALRLWRRSTYPSMW